MRASELWRRLTTLFRRDALDRDLDEELASHVEMATDDYLRQGVPPDEARRRALARLGGVAASRQRHREARGLAWLDALLQDAREIVRGLRRSPVLTGIAIVTLAVGLGVNTAAFAVADAVLFKGYARVRNDRIVYLRTQNVDRPLEYGYLASGRELDAWRQATTLADVGTSMTLWANLSDEEGLPERVYAGQVSVNTFRLLEQTPVLGRDFVDADQQPGAPPVVILAHGLWRSRYHGDPAVLGRSIRVNGVPTTIVGVMPDGFVFPQDTPFWLPLPRIADPDRRDYGLYARMTEGATRAQVEAELTAISRRLTAEAPLTEAGFVPLVWNFRQGHTGRPEALLYQSIWWAVAFLLAIACANLAGLLLARAMDRTREVSLRMALGAGRWRIVRQGLLESLLLAAMGGIAGWWIATWVVRTYVAEVFRGNSWYDFSMGSRPLIYLATVSAVAGLVFGVIPALRASRIDVHASLQDGGRGTTAGRADRRTANVLVVAQVALTVVLLTGAGVMLRTFVSILEADLGARTTDMTIAVYRLPPASYATPEARLAFNDRLAARLAALPGVERVTLASSAPTQTVRPVPYALPGDPTAAGTPPAVPLLAIGPAYFETLDARILSGRAFTDADGPSSEPVAIVNERFARAHWPGASAIGRRVRLGDGASAGAWHLVVGVASNIIQNDPTRQAFEPLVYVPYRQRPQMELQALLRSPVPAASLAPAVRREVQRLDADLPIDIRPLDERLRWGYDVNGFDAIVSVFVTLAGLALLLAALGLAALLAHAVSRRTQEFGVRQAVGATPGDIAGLVLAQAARPLGIGLLLGLPVAWTVTPVLRSALDHVAPADPAAVAIAALVLGIAAALGCLVPARRAMRVDPMEALRHD